MCDLVEFSAAGMSGWVREADPERRVLLLHGGPTMPHGYFESLVAVLPGWSVASYQQRGRAPSTSQGPFVVPTLIDDLAGVLDHLADQGWDRPLLAGHSWGGHLVWHARQRRGASWPGGGWSGSTAAAWIWRTPRATRSTSAAPG